MFSGILSKMEHHQLQRRADKLKEKLALQGLTNELVIEMYELKRAVDDLASRTDDELERLGLDK